MAYGVLTSWGSCVCDSAHSVQLRGAYCVVLNTRPNVGLCMFCKDERFVTPVNITADFAGVGTTLVVKRSCVYALSPVQ
jgi:hypothetical protein